MKEIHVYMIFKLYFLGYDLYDNCDDEDLTVDIMYPGIVGTANDCSPKNDNESQPVYAGM